MPKVVSTTKASDPESVDAFMAQLKHLLADLAEALRRAILATDRTFGEEIKWNAPAFFYTGAMRPFDAKEYRRHLVVFNFFRKDCICLVFWHGDRAGDTTGFLEGDYADGRRLAHFSGDRPRCEQEGIDQDSQGANQTYPEVDGILAGSAGRMEL
jgi:hypothetical protein